MKKSLINLKRKKAICLGTDGNSTQLNQLAIALKYVYDNRQ